jgi:hypothetical protein
MIIRGLAGWVAGIWLGAFLIFAGAAAAATPLPGANAPWPVPSHFDRVELVQLSGTHSLVAGGSALVGLGLPAALAPGEVRVTLNGVDVTGSFTKDSYLDPGFHGLVGQLTGLGVGANVVEASVRGPRTVPPIAAGLFGSSARLTLYNYPATGPVFSGPQLQPWFCTTTLFGLAAASDAACDAQTQVSYWYASTSGGFKPLPNLSQMPGDVASTTTTDGHTVPYIFRIETGTLDRGVYQIGILDDPFEPGHPGTRGWNRKLLYTFGGSCFPGNDQGPAGTLNSLTSGNPNLQKQAIAEGYAVATSTLNTYETDCNEVLSAEAMLIVKQHFVETYGVPDWTVGFGASGGSIQQLQIAANYPGLLNGIIPAQTFPDAASMGQSTLMDCEVLTNYFGSSTLPWTTAQEQAVEGFLTPGTCSSGWFGFRGPAILPGVCPPPVPAADVYNPVSNPQGVRCDIFDADANVYGRNPATGYGNWYVGNDGVQYGLNALLGGQISAAQFLDLNRRVGGMDTDGNFVSQRTAIPPAAVRGAYGTGRVLDQQSIRALLDVPIIDIRPWGDADPNNQHDERWSLILRARLNQAAGGSAGNYVFWVSPEQTSQATLQPTLSVEVLALNTIGRWLDAVAADPSHGPVRQTVAADRPVDATDGCWTSDGTRHDGTVTLGGTNFCSTTYPAYSTPRLEAGAQPTDAVIDCQLKPVNPADYNGKLTPDQLDQLRQIFPNGVCDWSAPSRYQTPFDGTWLSFGKTWDAR